MKLTVILTSVISPPAHKTTLSSFERFIQTVASIHSIQAQLPQADIILCDASEFDYGGYINNFFPSVHNCNLANIDPKVAQAIRGARNKSWGECRLLLTAFSQFRESIDNCDFVIKLSARYLPEGLGDRKWFVPQNRDKYLFCQQQEDDIRDWVDDRGFVWSLARNLEFPTIRRRVLRTILYAVGREVIPNFIKTIVKLESDFTKPEYEFYDIENLLAKELAPAIYSHRLIWTDWKSLGWNGMTAGLARY